MWDDVYHQKCSISLNLLSGIIIALLELGFCQSTLAFCSLVVVLHLEDISNYCLSKTPQTFVYPKNLIKFTQTCDIYHYFLHSEFILEGETGTGHQVIKGQLPLNLKVSSVIETWTFFLETINPKTWDTWVWTFETSKEHPSHQKVK